MSNTQDTEQAHTPPKPIPQGVRGGIPKAVERRPGDEGLELPKGRQATRSTPLRDRCRVGGPEAPGERLTRGRV